MIVLLLCAFNEDNDLPGLIDAISREKWPSALQVVVVDDGSTDHTGDILKEALKNAPITVLRHESNRGLGAALSTGLLHIARTIGEEDIVVTMDADGTHPIPLVAQLIEKLESGYDIAIASRYAPGGAQYGLPLYRRFLSRSAAILLCIIWPKRGVRDYTSGYRAFKGQVLRGAFQKYGESIVTEKGFGATLELLLKLGSISSKITEVPLELHYDIKKGKSKMKVFSTVKRYIMLILKRAFRRNDAV